MTARMVTIVLALVAAGCSSGGGDGAALDTAAVETDLGQLEPSNTGNATDRPVASDSPDSTSQSTVPPVEDGPLAEVCPKTIVIQTGSLPGPDTGPLYRLLGPDPTIDVELATVSSALVRADGTVEDVMLELRSGGPPVGFLAPLTLLAADPSILLAQASTSDALREAEASPAVGVVALTDRSTDVIIVDPATYPQVDSVDAVRKAGIEVRHESDAAFIDYLVATGALRARQVVAGFDGEPAAFVQSGGLIAQQGDLLVEPVLIPALPQWERPVVAIEARRSGWVDQDDALFARVDDVGTQRECLGRLVPVVQEAILAYVTAPESTNAVMALARAQFSPLSRISAELMNAGVGAGVDAGIFGGGADSPVGRFRTKRLAPFLTELADILAVEVVDIDELVTNEFVDPSITSEG